MLCFNMSYCSSVVHRSLQRLAANWRTEQQDRQSKLKAIWVVLLIYIYNYPLDIYIAMEHGPFIDDKHDDKPIKNGDFP